MCTLVKFAKIIRRPWAHPASYHKWEFGKNFLHSYFLCVLFTIYFFRSTKHVVSHLSSLFLPTAPQAMERKKWMLDNFLSATRVKKGLMFLLSWKMTIFPIFLCLLCIGEWWPTHRELPESLCLSAFILFICENKKIDSNEIILVSPIRKSSLGYYLKECAFYEKVMTNCKQYCWKFHFIKTIYFQSIRKLFVLGYFLIKWKISKFYVIKLV